MSWIRLSIAGCSFLFVYGTLRRGASNRHAAAVVRQANWVGIGKVQGRLYLIDWYPGMISAAGPDDWVIGDVYQVSDPTAIFPMLDEYEGSEFERVRSTALLDGGSAIECWLYLYRGQPREEQRILSGEFAAS